MAQGKKKLCFDCLHCKVSIKSTVKRRLCFCAMSGKKKNHREAYWLSKKICQEFDYMGA